MRKLWILSLVTLFIIGLSLPLLASQEGQYPGEILNRDKGEGGEREGGDVFKVNLVRAADIPAPDRLGPALVPIGNDPLARGKVEVNAAGRVEIEVRGAAPNKGYRLMFCKTGFRRNCKGVGNFRTNGNGRAEARFNFPVGATGNPASGLFVVKDRVPGGPGCGGVQCIQFVNGFRIMAEEEEELGNISIGEIEEEEVIIEP